MRRTGRFHPLKDCRVNRQNQWLGITRCHENIATFHQRQGSFSGGCCDSHMSYCSETVFHFYSVPAFTWKMSPIWNMASSCFFAFPDHDVQELSQQANSCWRPQWSSRKAKVPHSGLHWTVSSALGSATVCSYWKFWHPRDVQQLWSGPCFEGWRTSSIPARGLSGDTKRGKKTPSQGAEQVDSCQQIPKCLRGHGARSGALPTNIIRLWKRWQCSSHPVCRSSCT